MQTWAQKGPQEWGREEAKNKHIVVVPAHSAYSSGYDNIQFQGLTLNPGTSAGFSCQVQWWDWQAQVDLCPGCRLEAAANPTNKQTQEFYF